MLEKLFTSKNRVKILNFMLFEKTETHIREISRKLKISVSAVKREIDNLIKIGIITKQENKIELNKKSSILKDLKNMFIKTDSIVYPIKEAIGKNKKIQFALIFGSFANGNYREGSDIDLLVVGNIKLSEIYKLLKSLEEKTKREVNPVVWTLDILKKEKNSGFVKDIFKKNIIMIKGDENELRKIIE